MSMALQNSQTMWRCSLIKAVTFTNIILSLFLLVTYSSQHKETITLHFCIYTQTHLVLVSNMYYLFSLFFPFLYYSYYLDQERILSKLARTLTMLHRYWRGLLGEGLGKMAHMLTYW